MTNVVEQKLLSLVDREFNRWKLTDFTLDSSLIKDLGLDSLSIIELVIACEEEFQIEIDTDHPEFTQAVTLRALYDIIVGLLDQR
jgi:acyl carrier protein